MNEERDWNVVMATFVDYSGRITYYAQRKSENLQSEKILAQDLTEREAHALISTFGEARWRTSASGGLYFVQCRDVAGEP